MRRDKIRVKDKESSMGFSLIEILVSLVVFGLAMSAAGGAFYNIYQDWQRQKRYMQCIVSANWAVEFMAKELRQATGITIQTTLPVIWRARIQTPYSGSDYIWYWRGNQNVDNEANEQGYQGSLYRARTGSQFFRPLLPLNDRAFYNRQLLSGFVVNPSPNLLDNTTGFPPPDGLDDPVVILNGNLVTIVLTVRPNPDSASEGKYNRNYTVWTQVRRRN